MPKGPWHFRAACRGGFNFIRGFAFGLKLRHAHAGPRESERPSDLGRASSFFCSVSFLARNAHHRVGIAKNYRARFGTEHFSGPFAARLRFDGSGAAPRNAPSQNPFRQKAWQLHPRPKPLHAKIGMKILVPEGGICEIFAEMFENLMIWV